MRTFVLKILLSIFVLWGAIAFVAQKANDLRKDELLHSALSLAQDRVAILAIVDDPSSGLKAMLDRSSGDELKSIWLAKWSAADTDQDESPNILLGDRPAEELLEGIGDLIHTQKMSQGAKIFELEVAGENEELVAFSKFGKHYLVLGQTIQNPPTYSVLDRFSVLVATIAGLILVLIALMFFVLTNRQKKRAKNEVKSS